MKNLYKISILPAMLQTSEGRCIYRYIWGQKKNMCVYCHMLKKIRVGRSEIFFFFNLIFYN